MNPFLASGHGRLTMKRQQGFTLLELLVVMAIMGILLGLSTLSYMGVRRGAELRGAAMTIRTAMMLTRQQAVTKRKAMNLNIDSANSSLTVRYGSGAGPAYRTFYLSPGVQFDQSLNLTFLPTGSVMGGADTRTIVVKERPGVGNGVRTFTVWMLTGSTKEEG